MAVSVPRRQVLTEKMTSYDTTAGDSHRLKAQTIQGIAGVVGSVAKVGQQVYSAFQKSGAEKAKLEKPLLMEAESMANSSLQKFNLENKHNWGKPEYEGQLRTKAAEVYNQGRQSYDWADSNKLSFDESRIKSVDSLLKNNREKIETQRIKDAQAAAQTVAARAKDEAAWYGAMGDLDGFLQARNQQRSGLADYASVSMTPAQIEKELYDFDSTTNSAFLNAYAESNPEEALVLLTDERFAGMLSGDSMKNAVRRNARKKDIDRANELEKEKQEILRSVAGSSKPITTEEVNAIGLDEDDFDILYKKWKSGTITTEEVNEAGASEDDFELLARRYDSEQGDSKPKSVTTEEVNAIGMAEDDFDILYRKWKDGTITTEEVNAAGADEDDFELLARRYDSEVNIPSDKLERLNAIDDEIDDILSPGRPVIDWGSDKEASEKWAKETDEALNAHREEMRKTVEPIARKAAGYAKLNATAQRNMNELQDFKNFMDNPSVAEIESLKESPLYYTDSRFKTLTDKKEEWFNAQLEVNPNLGSKPIAIDDVMSSLKVLSALSEPESGDPYDLIKATMDDLITVKKSGVLSEEDFTKYADTAKRILYDQQTRKQVNWLVENTSNYYQDSSWLGKMFRLYSIDRTKELDTIESDAKIAQKEAFFEAIGMLDTKDPDSAYRAASMYKMAMDDEYAKKLLYAGIDLKDLEYKKANKEPAYFTLNGNILEYVGKDDRGNLLGKDTGESNAEKYKKYIMPLMKKKNEQE